MSKPKLMKLNAANYFSREANEQYWSASLFKAFLDCPARAMAELNGEWNPPPSTALLVGSYVDAAFESKAAFEAFRTAHPEIYKRDGTLKADFVKASEMYTRARRDPVFMEYMKGRHQVIKTGYIDGVPFKAKLDVLKNGRGPRRIVDLKTVKDLAPSYLPGQGRVDFATRWNWPLQGAIYQAIEGHHLPFFLAVITKEDPPGLALVEIEQERMDAEMDFIREKLPYFDAIKQGIIEPDRCESCAYCRASRKLEGPKPLESFIEIGGNSIE